MGRRVSTPASMVRPIEGSQHDFFTGFKLRSKLRIGAHNRTCEYVWVDNLAEVNIGINCCIS